MHRMILGVEKGVDVDHINGDGIDNRRFNLRACLRSENGRNRRLSKNNKSGYKGVCWNKSCNKWVAQIKYNYKEYSLGCFFCIIKAAKAYDKAAREYFGEFARTNFPEEKE
ncbi:unnamed protein product [marine sediment metagenome]|uniref:AP2/ERF domain-containing protein n=1 Tax=marine sediment metagenome TaxID=412755 RepID=X0WZ60_9ZZZZ